MRGAFMKLKNKSIFFSVLSFHKKKIISNTNIHKCYQAGFYFQWVHDKRDNRELDNPSMIKYGLS